MRCATSANEKFNAHEGFFHSLMRAMTSPGLPVQHWSWLPSEIQTDPNSKILFFGGCAPYFDTFFKNHLGINTSDILVDALRLMNFFDIRPAILPKREVLRPRSAVVRRPRELS